MAVILRRGPTRDFQMLTWDFDTDIVTPGQWIRGRVYTALCDVSPDGRYVVVSATNCSPQKVHLPREQYVKEQLGALGFLRRHKPGITAEVRWDDFHLLHAWTSISRPPFFTPLTVWECHHNWEGGGVWRGDREVDLQGLSLFLHWCDELPPPQIAVYPLVPIEFNDRSYYGWPDEPMLTLRQLSKGWRFPTRLRNKLARDGAIGIGEGFVYKEFSGGFIKRQRALPNRWSLYDACGCAHSQHLSRSPSSTVTGVHFPMQ